MVARPKAKPAPREQPAAATGRVVRAEDWSATPARGMAAFSYTPFNARGKSPSTAEAESPSAALAAQYRQREEQAQKAWAAERKAHEETLRQVAARALEQGRHEGETAARARYDEALRVRQSEVQEALRTLRDGKAAAFMEFESHAAGILSFALQRVFQEFSGNFSEAVLPLIREAIASLGRSATLIVKVHPSDLPLVEERRGFWQRLDLPGDDVRCVADERVPQGGCLLVADATAARIDLESLGHGLAQAVEAACAEKRRLVSGAPTPAEATGE